MISIVIPAYNEGRVIGRLLEQLTSDAHPGEFDVIVIANGCTDDTVKIAEGFGSPVRVLTMEAASKAQALSAGDQAALAFPRVYVDADVEIGTKDLRLLTEALARPDVLAAAPERELPLADRPRSVRWFYDIWTRLPEVQNGLFGRGVIAVGEQGHSRIRGLHHGVISDDLVISLAFKPGERAIVRDAHAVIHPPRTFADLLKRRIRVMEGTAQLKSMKSAPDAGAAQTTWSSLISLARRDPGLTPRIGLFFAIAVLARFKARRSARRNHNSVWHRDESSRQAPVSRD